MNFTSNIIVLLEFLKEYIGMVIYVGTILPDVWFQFLALLEMGAALFMDINLYGTTLAHITLTIKAP